MADSRESMPRTCPATLSHLIGLFGIDVEDISTRGKGGQSCEGHVRKDRPSSGAVSALLAMYDRLERNSAIKLHFRGIRASLNNQHVSGVLCVPRQQWDLTGNTDMQLLESVI